MGAVSVSIKPSGAMPRSGDTWCSQSVAGDTAWECRAYMATQITRMAARMMRAAFMSSPCRWHPAEMAVALSIAALYMATQITRMAARMMRAIFMSLPLAPTDVGCRLGRPDSRIAPGNPGPARPRRVNDHDAGELQWMGTSSLGREAASGLYPERPSRVKNHPR